MALKHPTLAEFFAHNPGELSWKPLTEGVAMAHLLKDPGRDYTVILLRFAAGGRAMRHRHPESEQYMVLEGSIEDEHGRYPAGTFVNQPPGSVHEPWSDDGALVLVSWFGKLEAYA